LTDSASSPAEASSEITESGVDDDRRREAGDALLRRTDALIAEYAQVNENFRLLTDIRFKLLAFLPIAAVAGAAVAKASTSSSDSLAQVAALVLSLFGLAVTAGLATYNDRNDQLYDTLIGRAASIERKLGVRDGAFSHRPNPWFTIGLGIARWKVDHRNGVGTIYTASFALWLTAALISVARLVWSATSPPGWIYGVAVVLAITVTLLGRIGISRQRKRRSKRMRRAAVDAVELAQTHGWRTAANRGDFQRACAELLGSSRFDEVERRASFYADPARDAAYYMATGPPEAAVQFVALVSDLPPEWIRDVSGGRR
jgi:hypothetical protein